MRSKKTRRDSRRRAPVKSLLLDAFTERELEVWETRSVDLQSYHDRVYYDLERQRAARYEEHVSTMTNSLRAILTRPMGSASDALHDYNVEIRPESFHRTAD